jgi:hypothetical protein
MLVGTSEAICLLPTYLISISYFSMYSLQNMIFFCKESINDVINNNEIDTQTNEDTKKSPIDKDQRFYE